MIKIRVPIVILIIATAVAIASDVFLTDFLTLQNNSLEVIHGTGKNKFLALHDHSGRYRISDFSLILALKSDVRYNVKVNQLPDNDVISIPILGSLIDNRLPEKDEYCAHPFPVAAHPVFEKLKSSEVTEVLFPTGCSTSFWVYGSDVIINEYFPRPYFSLVLTTGDFIPFLSSTFFSRLEIINSFNIFHLHLHSVIQRLSLRKFLYAVMQKTHPLYPLISIVHMQVLRLPFCFILVMNMMASILSTNLASNYIIVSNSF